MTPMVKDFAKCGCGRSKNAPWCDGSHALPIETPVTYPSESYPVLPELPVDSDLKRNPYAST